MLIDELIEKLTELRTANGNIPVCCHPYSGSMSNCTIDYVEVVDKMVFTSRLPAEMEVDKTQPKCVYIGGG